MSKTLLIGVAHKLANLEQVIRFLGHTNIEDKKVMVELHKYPLTENDLNRYFPETKDFFQFFCSIGDYIYRRNGSLIYGENKKIVDEMCLRYSSGNQSGKSFKETSNLEMRKRENYHLKTVQEKNPDIIILGKSHLPFLIENHFWAQRLPYCCHEIPDENFLFSEGYIR